MTDDKRAESDAERLGIKLWIDLCEKDDRTSPEEYPNMALITQDELCSVVAIAFKDRDSTIAAQARDRQEHDRYYEGVLEEREAEIAAQAGQLALQKEEIERLNGMLGDVGRELDDQAEEIERLRAVEQAARKVRATMPPGVGPLTERINDWHDPHKVLRSPPSAPANVGERTGWLNAAQFVRKMPAGIPSFGDDRDDWTLDQVANEIERAAPVANVGEQPEADRIGQWGAWCFDCGRPYGDEHGFPDLVIENWAWTRIAPIEGNGLLCPSCICKRLHDAGIECEGRFKSGPLSPPPAVMIADPWPPALTEDAGAGDDK